MLRKQFLSTLRLVLALLVLGAISAERASAGLISEVFAPDITAGYVHASYSSDTDILQMSGWALTLENPAGVLNDIWAGSDTSYPAAPGSFALNATFDSAGNFGGGDFEITGTLDQTEAKVTLLKGTLVEAEGALLPSGVLEFIADGSSIDGTLASLFGNNQTPPFGIRVSQLGSGFSFAQSFSYTPLFSGAVADIGRAVPEPSSMAIFASCLAIGCCRRVRRKRVA